MFILQSESIGRFNDHIMHNNKKTIPEFGNKNDDHIK